MQGFEAAHLRWAASSFLGPVPVKKKKSVYRQIMHGVALRPHAEAIPEVSEWDIIRATHGILREIDGDYRDKDAPFVPRDVSGEVLRQ
jgi:hypothetical protein